VVPAVRPVRFAEIDAEEPPVVFRAVPSTVVQPTIVVAVPQQNRLVVLFGPAKAEPLMVAEVWVTLLAG
jgi:hypothetical protein